MIRTLQTGGVAQRCRAGVACAGRNLFWLLAPVLLLGLALVEPRIVSGRNLLNLLMQTSYMAIFATAQMVVILARGFDLSLGACVSLVSVCAALAMSALGSTGIPVGWVVLAGLAAGLAVGGLLGLFNGWCTARLRVNPFIVTLGSMSAAFGIASMVTGGRPVFDLPDAFSIVLYEASWLGLSVPVWIAVLLCLGTHLMLRRTVFGRSIVLVGSNPVATAVAGIAVRRTTVWVYLYAALLTAVGALMLTARTGSGEPGMGSSLLLPSIAAAVVGGLSLQGGVGGVLNAVMGALFISVLSNGMNLIEVDGYLQDIVLGAVILLALYLDRFRSRA